MYSFVPKFYEMHSYIMRENLFSDKLILIENGCVEIFTYFEGNKFIIENLGPGTIINYRTFFIEDRVHVNFQCATNVNLLYLDLVTF